MLLKHIDVLRKMVLDEGIDFDIEKDILSTQTVNYDGQLPVEAVAEIIDLTMAQDGWLKQIPHSTETGSKSTILISNWAGPAAFPKGKPAENKREAKPVHPSSWNVPYECEEYRSDFILTRKELREAKRRGITSFNQIQRAAYAKALNNTLADLAINGDKTLAGNDDWELSRMGVDGFLVKTSGALITDREGAAFTKEIFPYCVDKMPDIYTQGGGLRWFCNQRVLNRWKKAVGGVVSTASFDGLSAQAITQESIMPPEGIKPITVPHIGSTMGPSADADNVADATGKVKVRCDTALRGYASAKAGRSVKVVHKETGLSETGVVADDTSHLEFTSAGLFGLAVADTTASHYSVYVYDETVLMLTNPQNFRVVFDGDWRTYSEFDTDAENFVVKNHFSIGLVLVNPGALVKIINMYLPAITLT